MILTHWGGIAQVKNGPFDSIQKTTIHAKTHVLTCFILAFDVISSLSTDELQSWNILKCKKHEKMITDEHSSLFCPTFAPKAKSVF